MDANTTLSGLEPLLSIEALAEHPDVLVPTIRDWRTDGACSPRRASTSTSPTAATITSSASPATQAAAPDYAATNEEQIAAHFPVPNDDVADRLVDLLLPRGRIQPKGEQVA